MLSEAIKIHRNRRGWSLREVARRSGISPSALSKVERGDLSLTYDKLEALAKGLEIEIGALFNAEGGGASAEPTTRRSFARIVDGEEVVTPTYTFHYMHTDLAKKAFNPIITDINAKTIDEFGPLISHAGEEYSYVLEGEVTLITEHYSPLVMRAGESVYFDSTMRHAYLNTGGTPARIVCITSKVDLSAKTGT